MLAHPAASQNPPVPSRWLGSEERSERQIALRQRTARMHQIDGLGVPAEVRENPLDRCGLLDAGDDPQPAAAAPAGLDVDGEYPLEALRPCQGPLLVGDGCLALTDYGGAGSGHNSGPIRARRREHAVVADQ